MTKQEFENLYYVFCMQDEESQERFIKESVYSLGKPLVERAVKGEINPYKLIDELRNFNNGTEMIRKELETEDWNE